MKSQCQNCYEDKGKNRMFCSLSCRIEAKRNILTVDCRRCGKSFGVRSPFRKERAIFCSRLCYKQDKLGEKRAKRQVCQVCSIEFYARPGWIRAGGAKYCTKRCFGLAHRCVPASLGSAKDGAAINAVFRKHHGSSANYRRWRKAVLTRDKHRCVECGSRKKLETNHIKSFASMLCDFLEANKGLRMEQKLRRFNDLPKLNDPNNGETLCHSCHAKTDSYGIPKTQ